jgi:hypothetical protein
VEAISLTGDACAEDFILQWAVGATSHTAGGRSPDSLSRFSRTIPDEGVSIQRAREGRGPQIFLRGRKVGPVGPHIAAGWR